MSVTAVALHPPPNFATTRDCCPPPPLPQALVTNTAVLPPRTLLEFQVPPGTLQMNISVPSKESYGHVWVASIHGGSPVLGTILPGDWIMNVNGMPVTSQDECVELFRSTAMAPRMVLVSRAATTTPMPVFGGNNNHAVVVPVKGNARNVSSPAAETTSAIKPTAAKSKSPSSVMKDPLVAATTTSKRPKPLPDVSVLIEMTVVELKKELKQRGLSQAGTKDDLLERLGVPSKQWKVWRKMTVANLKRELRLKGHSAGGNKTQLLTRLGVPEGFGETVEEKRKRYRQVDNPQQRSTTNNSIKRQKLQEISKLVIIEQLKKEISKTTTTSTCKNPYDDPNHEEYTLPCCDAPRFAGYGQSQPAGYINFPDGSIMEVWRCLACGNIPQRPNAPPIVEYSSDDHEQAELLTDPLEDDYDDFIAYCNRFGLEFDD